MPEPLLDLDFVDVMELVLVELPLIEPPLIEPPLVDSVPVEPLFAVPSCDDPDFDDPAFDDPIFDDPGFEPVPFSSLSVGLESPESGFTESDDVDSVEFASAPFPTASTVSVFGFFQNGPAKHADACMLKEVKRIAARAIRPFIL
jgi:hypothetical protein